MSKKKNRINSSFMLSIHKASVRLITYRPSPVIVAAIVMGISIFLLGGGIYNIMMDPLAVLPIGSGRFISYVPYRIHEQLLMGSLSTMVLYLLGAVGLLLIYSSTKHIRNPNQVSLLTKIGLALLIVAFIFVEAVMFWILHFQ